MPLYSVPKLDVANLASKLPRPLQYPVGAALGGLMSIFGGDDPQSMMPAPGGMEAAPLISIYKDAAGVPSAALREAATQEFLKSARGLGSDAIQNAAGVFAERYPRIAAHMKIDPSLHATSDYRAVTGVSPFGVENPVPIGYSNVGLQQSESNPRQAMDTMFHEGTHVAQSLGNRYTDLLYKLGLKLPGGYERHPMEEAARLAGLKAAGEADPYATAPAIRGLKNAAQIALTGPVSKPLEMRRAAKNILDIINARAK